MGDGRMMDDGLCATRLQAAPVSMGMGTSGGGGDAACVEWDVRVRWSGACECGPGQGKLKGGKAWTQGVRMNFASWA